MARDAHRLLKNEVNADAYILLTKAARDRLTADPLAAQTLIARYAHFGELTCFVLLLESVFPRSRRALGDFTEMANDGRGNLPVDAS